MNETSLKEFIEKLTLRKAGVITAETPLLSSGLVDSASLLQLVAFVEKQCGCKIKPRDMTLKNFDSAARILAFVETSGK